MVGFFFEIYLVDKKYLLEWDEIDIFIVMFIKIINFCDRVVDLVVDNKFLFKNLMNGFKNIVYQLKSCNLQGSVDLIGVFYLWVEVVYGFIVEEVKVIIKLFCEGVYVFRYYEIEKLVIELLYSFLVEFMVNFYMVFSGKEEKDFLEIFVMVFYCIDVVIFYEVF